VDERIGVNIFEQHRTHLEPTSQVGFHIALNAFWKL